MRTIVMLILTMALTSCTTTIYLVRHAEKRDGTPNSPLSAEGEKRAMALKDALSGKKIDAIYTTDYLRTQMTAQPLAQAIGKEIITYKPDAQFTEQLKKLKNKNVLVVGHSNTVPEIIRGLTSERITIGEDDFHNLYTIRMRGSGKTKITFTARKYGAAH